MTSERSVKRARRAFLESLVQDDFDVSRRLYPGTVTVESQSRGAFALLIVRRGQSWGYRGKGSTPMEALRDAAWNWLDGTGAVRTWRP